MKIEKALNEDEDISDSNIEIIYDKNDNTKNDTSVWNNYLTFSEQSVRASG
ncbi:MAG: hypothetical protein LBD88_05300 [Candidatus Peribacteria bacterium]|jgi:hypothetical protein|nr:hypothetical protein [Candidatus Peribacteria bacterium]